MKPCHICGLHFRDSYNLNRHMKLKHQNDQSDQEDSGSEQESDDEREESDVDEPQGKRPRDLFDDDNDDSDESDATDNEEEDDSQKEKPQPETDVMIDNVYGEFEEAREEMVDKLIEEGQDERQAREEVHQYFVPKYQKAFRHKLTNTLVRLNQLRQEPIYKVVMDTASDLRAEGLGHEESIRAAISKRKHKINAYIPEEYDSEDEEEDTDDEDEEPTSKRFKKTI